MRYPVWSTRPNKIVTKSFFPYSCLQEEKGLWAAHLLHLVLAHYSFLQASPSLWRERTFSECLISARKEFDPFLTHLTELSFKSSIILFFSLLKTIQVAFPLHSEKPDFLSWPSGFLNWPTWSDHCFLSFFLTYCSSPCSLQLSFFLLLFPLYI